MGGFHKGINGKFAFHCLAHRIATTKCDVEVWLLHSGETLKGWVGEREYTAVWSSLCPAASFCVCKASFGLEHLCEFVKSASWFIHVGTEWECCSCAERVSVCTLPRAAGGMLSEAWTKVEHFWLGVKAWLVADISFPEVAQLIAWSGNRWGRDRSRIYGIHFRLMSNPSVLQDPAWWLLHQIHCLSEEKLDLKRLDDKIWPLTYRPGPFLLKLPPFSP